MINEILKNCGIEAEKANEIVKAMNDAKVYTTKLENADVRYSKLQEQNKQLKEASNEYQEKLEELQKNNSSVEELNKMVEQLQLSNKELEANHKNEMDKLQFDFALDKSLSSAKIKDTKLVRALLDMDSIKYQEGKINGLESQIEAIKSTHSYLFEEEKAGSTGSVGNFGRTGTTDSDPFMSGFNL